MERKKIYVFDFDGTLTTADTLLEFIRFACGRTRMLLGFALYSPWIVLMKLHLYPSAHLIRPAAADYVRRVAPDAYALYVVSASLDNWVRPTVERWLCGSGSNTTFTVAGTRPEVCDGRLTGHFATPNCYGAEKVRRLTALLDGDRQQYFITAFGDSRGDKELLNYADKAHYKPFRD